VLHDDFPNKPRLAAQGGERSAGVRLSPPPLPPLRKLGHQWFAAKDRNAIGVSRDGLLQVACNFKLLTRLIWNRDLAFPI